MRRLILSLTLVVFCTGVAAQPMGTPTFGGPPVVAKSTPKPAPKRPVKKRKKPAPKLPPAREMFGSVATPAPLAARAIGSYSKGCLAGGVSLAIDGPDWQVMRLSRNRNWGSPQLIDFLERLASDARGQDGWPGLLVGDLSQPRGGPMLTGHTSHQVGLDADIWLTPMPDRTLTPEEREEMSAVTMLKDPLTVDPAVFTDAHVKLIRRAASYPQVARIFVHPAIKKALCERAGSVGKNRAWLGKVRPWWNHHYHFHVRLSCPPGMAGCKNQKPVKGDSGCGGQELKNWYSMLRKSAIWTAQQPIDPDAKPSKKKNVRLRDLPRDCKTVLLSGGSEPLAVDAELPEAALRAAASKEAGPSVPRLDEAQLQAWLGGGRIGMEPPDRNPIR